MKRLRKLRVAAQKKLARHVQKILRKVNRVDFFPRRPRLADSPTAIPVLTVHPEGRLVIATSKKRACHVKQLKPTVSIVIAVYGQSECVYRCLRSLRAHSSKYLFEVIVVDDLSPDETPSMLSRVDGIKLISNQSNLGFLKSCNRGAAEALGELLVMLNSDTVVQPGWLDALVDTFNAYPEAGLVGSKLVYPDGRLQEAGGLIWSDGSGWNIGRMGDQMAPEFNYLREVDYCSGASIMVPRKLWNSLGGFDEEYAPAYAEDSDLAFRVRKAGRRVFYQPRSVVVHYEGMSCGRDTSTGVKSHQVKNAAKLRLRWEKEMRAMGEPGHEPNKAKDRNVNGRLLVLDHCNPTPDQDAGSITALNIMRIFRSLGWKVTFVPEDNFLHADPYTAEMQGIGIECLYHPYVNSVRRHLEEHGSDYDAMLVFRSSCLDRHLQTIREVAPNAKIIYHTSDLHYLREQREAALSESDEMRKKAERTRNAELALVKSVDATIVHSSEEQQLLLKETGGNEEIFLFPWAIDIPGTLAGWESRDGLIFLGGFQHTPNVDAVLHFVSKIWPLVRKKFPDAVFRVVGSRVPPRIRELHGSGIEICGFVPDLASMLDRTRVMVVPLRYGAGIKGKIGSSLSHGLPVVATTIGAEGMDLAEGDGVLVADDPSEFVDKISILYEDVTAWERESRGGINFAKRKYSLEAGCAIISNLLVKIGLEHLANDRRPMPQLEGISSDFYRCYPPDFPSDPLVDTVTHTETQGCRGGDSHATRQSAYRRLEKDILSRISKIGKYLHQGFCRACGTESEFVAVGDPGEPGHIRWEKSMVCTSCGLNNAQRAVAHAMHHHLRKQYKDRAVDVCVISEESPLSDFVRKRFRDSGIFSGEIFLSDPVREKRDYDAVLVSGCWSDFQLLERIVTHSRSSLREGGRIFLSYYSPNNSQGRHTNPEDLSTSISNGDIPARHGWDPWKLIKDAGFKNPEVCFYWSDVYGHFGEDQFYVSAQLA